MLKQIQPNIRPPLKSSISSISVNKLIGIFAAVADEEEIERLGPELMPAVAVWAAAGGAWWNAGFDANWSGDGVDLTSDGNDGFLGRGGFWVIGRRYRVVVTGVRLGGDCATPYDGAGFDAFFSVTGVVTSNYLVDSGPNMYLYSLGFNGDITGLSIREIISYNNQDE